MKSNLLFILLIPTVLHPQDVNFQWVKQSAGGSAVAVDATGNVYTTDRNKGFPQVELTFNF